MLTSTLTFLSLMSALVALAACVVGMTAAARATAINVSRLLSTEVKALLADGQASAEEAKELAVKRLKRLSFKSLLVFLVALAIGFALAVLRDIVLTGNWRGS